MALAFVYRCEDGSGRAALSGLPPLKWPDLKYGFDHGGEEEWLGNGIVLKR